VTPGELVATVALAGALVPCGLRWLRVAQAEHYHAGSALRFARRWWTSRPENLALDGMAAVGAVATVLPGPARTIGALLVALVVGCGPVGLSPRGRTSKLAWTRRLRTLAATWGVIEVAVVAAAIVLRGPAPVPLAIGALATPLLVDLACFLTGPFEERLAGRWVQRAAAKVADVAPLVVGITGSYGKTSTKLYVGHLAGGTRAVVVSPRSFNNRAGLARAVNEHLAPGSEVFVAEMGAYGPGEIAELCKWLPPEIGVITAIGPVHLERFGTEDAIVRAKSEILAPARVAVLNVDDPRLAVVADAAARAGKTVWRCSALDRAADVAVVSEGEQCIVLRSGREIVRVGELGAPASNVACAVAVALALEVPEAVVARRLVTLPPVENRLSPRPGATGATILDDTFNSNPVGAARALDALCAAAPDGRRRVVVTPGMVELGPRQAEENRAFAAAAAEVATAVVVVGRTNRAPLVQGAAGGAAEIVVVDTLPEAVAWVSKHVGPGDAVLYENDLPDVYP
jgi:UDP-N-acetylmuramoyl-tripeptide--D-alanyl-D-alanine ligase